MCVCVCACWLAYVCARVRIYACMIIILSYYICGCSACVRVCGRVCTYVHANIYAHVSAGA